MFDIFNYIWNVMNSKNIKKVVEEHYIVRDKNFVKKKTVEEIFELGAEVMKTLNKDMDEEEVIARERLIAKELVGVIIQIFLLSEFYSQEDMEKEFVRKMEQINNKNKFLLQMKKEKKDAIH